MLRGFTYGSFMLDKAKKHKNSIRNVPKVSKAKARQIYANKGLLDEWLLFAEGMLRNGFVREQLLSRMGGMCDWCLRKFNREDASIQSRIESHHREYMHVCTYKKILLDGDKDIRRKPIDGESLFVPDCRSCYKRYVSHDDRSFWNCFNLIKPVHAACHEKIHDREMINKERSNKRIDIRNSFKTNAVDPLIDP